MIRNLFNQVLQLTQDSVWESDSVQSKYHVMMYFFPAESQPRKRKFNATDKENHKQPKIEDNQNDGI